MYFVAKIQYEHPKKTLFETCPLYCPPVRRRYVRAHAKETRSHFFQQLPALVNNFHGICLKASLVFVHRFQQSFHFSNRKYIV